MKLLLLIVCYFANTCFSGLSASLPSILSLFSVSFAYLYSDSSYIYKNDDKMGEQHHGQHGLSS